MNIKTLITAELEKFKAIIIQFQRDWISLFEA
jgi:hypothetical protein